MQDTVDIAIIGAGVVGCAVARTVADGKRSVVVLEAGPRIAEGVTSRNSGVVHSGLYYPPRSLKALSCVEGNHLLWEWVAKKGIAHARTGKLVVAREAQLEALEQLATNAKASGAPGVELVSAAGIAEREPAIADAGYVRALWCPESGVVDPYELTRSFLMDAESRGAMLLVSAAVHSIESVSGGFHLETARGPLDAERLVNAAGLAADEIAALAGVRRYHLHPCRGDYFFLSTTRRYRRLVYPVKDPKSPGLGLHLTIDLSGRYRIGPDAEYCDRRDDFTSPPDAKREAFRVAAEALLGWPVPLEALSFDTRGIRPKLRAPEDSEEKDFILAEDLPGLVNLVGIESPGLTGAMALAERVRALVA